MDQTADERFKYSSPHQYRQRDLINLLTLLLKGR